MATLFLTLAMSAAPAQQIGSATLIEDMSGYEPGSPALDHNSINVALTLADGELWFAVEHAYWDHQIPWDDIEPELDLVWDDGTSLDEKTLSTGRIGPDEGGMYPALVTWPGEANVYVVGKQSVDQTSNETQLEFFVQDRDNLSSAVSSSALGNTPDTVHHGRPLLTYDYNDTLGATPTEQLYVCATTEETDTAVDSTPDEDLGEKAKDPGETWGSASGHSLLAESPDGSRTDDHCDLDFDQDGFRFGVGHSVQSGHKVVLDIDAFDPSTETWSTSADFQLALPAGVGGVNFPTLSIADGSVYAEYVVVAEEFTTSGDLVLVGLLRRRDLM